ncbi:MAG: phage antirepressor protein [Rikenellaceae bacterium]
MEDNRVILFEDRQIRREYFDNEWYFSVVDVVGVLSDSVNPTDYLKGNY